MMPGVDVWLLQWLCTCLRTRHRVAGAARGFTTSRRLWLGLSTGKRCSDVVWAARKQLGIPHSKRAVLPDRWLCQCVPESINGQATAYRAALGPVDIAEGGPVAAEQYGRTN